MDIISLISGMLVIISSIYWFYLEKNYKINYKIQFVRKKYLVMISIVILGFCMIITGLIPIQL